MVIYFLNGMISFRDQELEDALAPVERRRELDEQLQDEEGGSRVLVHGAGVALGPLPHCHGPLPSLHGQQGCIVLHVPSLRGYSHTYKYTERML